MEKGPKISMSMLWQMVLQCLGVGVREGDRGQWLYLHPIFQSTSRHFFMYLKMFIRMLFKNCSSYLLMFEIIFVYSSS